jgi:hypothetical protein
MDAFMINMTKPQIGPVLLHGTTTSTTFTIDANSTPMLSQLTSIRWKATADVRVRFNLKLAPTTGYSDDAPYFIESEGIINLHPSVKSVHFSMVPGNGPKPVKIYFQFA